MIVASLLLILVAVVLLVLGLTSGSSPLLTTSIAASLLAAVALVAGARQAAASRAAAGRVDPDTAPGDRPPAGGVPPAGAYPPPGSDIPAQHVPPTVGADDTGWRQPPGSPVAGGDPYDPYAEPVSPAGAPTPADEPPVLPVSPADAALVAELDAEVHVVDGRPRYHLPDCPHLYALDAEPLPVAEAVRLGFTPCARCAPDTVLLADAGPF
ncbi:hypothetical protein [Micromonospora okii]|uniref:hypothetical protein n=1 Tax=Micromonospora okii TaxID=1182970 RepID=UPI001E35EB4B|nr:hypothetical protein [Micromonospora okii]